MSTTSTSGQPLPFLWHHDDVGELSRSESFADIGNVAVKVLRRSKEKRVMVSGPITSGGGRSKQENLARYSKAIDYRERTDTMGRPPVFNQLPVEAFIGPLHERWKRTAMPGDYCYELLHKIYAPLFHSGLIVGLVLMDDAHTSTGSQWELAMAKELGFTLEHLPGNWELHHSRLLAKAS